MPETGIQLGSMVYKCVGEKETSNIITSKDNDFFVLQFLNEALLIKYSHICINEQIYLLK